MSTITQHAPIRAKMKPRVDKFDEAGEFLETVEGPEVEITLSFQEAQAMGLAVPPAEAPGPASQGD